MLDDSRSLATTRATIRTGLADGPYEANAINFAPRLPPTLLLHGKNDEVLPYYTELFPLWNLLPEPKKLVAVEGAGHVPPLEVRVPAIKQWLDKTLGPVRTRR